MTRRADQVLVVGDDRLTDWLRDRFGVDTELVLLLDSFTITGSRTGPVVLQLQLLVGADDLAAFPELSEQ